MQITRIDFALGCAPQEALVAAVIPWLRAEGEPRSGRSTELARFEIRGGRMTGAMQGGGAAPGAGLRRELGLDG